MMRGSYKERELDPPWAPVVLPVFEREDDSSALNRADVSYWLMETISAGFVSSKDGTTIAFDRSGQGPAVILVQGAFQYRAIDPKTKRLAELLSKRFTVFNYDRRGRGDSEDTMPYVVEREIEDLEALIGAAGGAALVFGMSSGAVLALRAAAQGLKIKKVALYEPPFNTGDDNARRASENYTRQLTALLKEDRRGDAVALTLTTWGVPAEAINGMRHTPVWSNLLSVAPTLAYDDAIMGDGSVPSKLMKAVVVPVLAIGGGASPPFMRNAIKAVAECLPNSSSRTLEGQVHDVDPEVLAPVLEEFFSGP